MRYLLLTSFVFTALIALAQTGKIRGTVIEDENGMTVIGANAVIMEPLTGVSTDLDGKFTLETAPGTYEVQISFISFQTIIIKDVVVKANEVTQLGNIRMKSSALALNEVVVTATATRKSEAALNTMKKKSATMMDGISSQKMALTGDGTAVEAAQRVTGVSIEGGKYIYVRGLGDRYSKVTLNGMDIPGLDPDKNSLQMDIFPTNLIDNIVVAKNFTAELPADFTGGLVNIETKSFPDEKILSASVGISYNPNMHFNSDYLSYEGGKTDWLGYDDGTRRLPKVARSEFIPKPYSDDDVTVQDFASRFDPTLGAEKQTSFLDYSASVTVGDQISLNKEGGKRNPKLGYIFSLSYKSDQVYYDDVTYAEYQRETDASINELKYADRQVGQVGKQNNLVGILGGLAYKTTLSKYRMTIMRLQNGESSATQFKIDQNSDAVGRSGYTAGSDNLVYNERSLTNLLLNGKHVSKDRNWEVDWRYSPSFSTADDPDIRKTAFTFSAVDTSFQAGNAGNPSRIWRELSEINSVGKVDITRNYTLFEEDAKLKFGFSHTYKSRDYEIIGYNIQFSGSQNWRQNNPNEVLDPTNIFPNGPSYFVSSYNRPNPNEYKANATNIAAYVSNEFSINSSLKTIIGLRLESFKQRHTGRDQAFSQGNGGNNLDDEIVLEGTDIFPTINFIYNIAEEQNLRFAYAKTIARPSFKELSFAQILDPVTGRTFNGALFAYPGDWDGKLEATDIDNIDFRWEKFMPRGQIYSASVFYKRFQNPIELVRIPVVNTAFEYQPRNVGEAELIGIELEATKSLDFLGSKFEKFSASGNITLVSSSVEMSRAEYDARLENKRVGESIEKTRSMAGQAPYVINFGITYSNQEKGINSGLFYNVNGPTLLIVGTGFVPDIYQESFHSLNYGITKKIGKDKNTAIDLKVSNILNDVREELFRSHQATDQIFSSFNPGTAIGIGISHQF